MATVDGRLAIVTTVLRDSVVPHLQELLATMNLRLSGEPCIETWRPANEDCQVITLQVRIREGTRA